MRDQVARAPGLGADLALPHLEVGFVVGLALGVHAELKGLLTERLALDPRRPALGAHGGLALERAHLDAARHRVGHVAIGPPHAADKAPARLGARLHHQVLAALGARAHAGVGGHGVADGVAELLRVIEQLVDDPREQRARVHDHVLLGVLAMFHARHVLIELGRHIGTRDARGELGQRVDHRDAELTRLNGVVLQIAHGVEALDDARTGRLGAEAALFHLLHELALAVARGRLGLLGLELDIVHVHSIALVERRELLIALKAVGVRLAEARIDQNIARCHERLAGNIDGELGVLDGRRPHERCQEAAGDEVVELLLAAVER